jgi:hypothetical protein
MLAGFLYSPQTFTLELNGSRVCSDLFHAIASSGACQNPETGRTSTKLFGGMSVMSMRVFISSGTGQPGRVGTLTKKQKALLTQSLDRTLAALSFLEQLEQADEREIAILTVMAAHEYAQHILGPRAASKVWAKMEEKNRAH